MLSVTYKLNVVMISVTYKLSVVMISVTYKLSVVMISVMAPVLFLCLILAECVKRVSFLR